MCTTQIYIVEDYRHVFNNKFLHCLLKGILSQQRTDTKFLQSIYFAYWAGIISSCSNCIYILQSRKFAL